MLVLSVGDAMRRREFIAFIGSIAAAWPLVARAQQSDTVRRIGVLMGAFASTNPEGQAALAAFLNALQGLGWTSSRNAQIDVRWMGDEVELGKTLRQSWSVGRQMCSFAPQVQPRISCRV